MLYMYRTRWLAMLLICTFFLSACGSETSQSEVMLYQSDETEAEEINYTTTTVRKETYTEKISTTGELEYQNEQYITIGDSRAYVDKYLVKNGQKVNKGDALVKYHLEISDISMQKKKLKLDQAVSQYESDLKSKKNEVLQQQRTIKNITDETEKEIAKIELSKLKSEYKDILKQKKSINKQKREYNTLVRKRKGATLKSKYAGTVSDVLGDTGESSTDESLMTIRDDDDFLIIADDGDGLRYNMTVTIGLGKTSKDIKYKLKGTVISTDNIQSSDEYDEYDSEGSASKQIRISKSNRKKYDFTKYKIYITGVSLKVEDALVVDADAVYEETDNDDVKLYVYVVEDGNLHKRYIVSNYSQDKCYLVTQGLTEGQTLAIQKN